MKGESVLGSEPDARASDDAAWHARVAALRSAFDQTFGVAPISETGALEDLIAIRVGDDPYAVRRSELVGLMADRKIVPLPSALPGLLGLTSLRGALLPVYSLGAALGYPSPPRPPRWMAVTLAARDQPLGLAFDEFERYLRVRSDQLGAAPELSPSHVREILRGADHARPVIRAASVAADIAQRAERARLGREA